MWLSLGWFVVWVFNCTPVTECTHIFVCVCVLNRNQCVFHNHFRFRVSARIYISICLVIYFLSISYWNVNVTLYVIAYARHRVTGPSENGVNAEPIFERCDLFLKDVKNYSVCSSQFLSLSFLNSLYLENSFALNQMKNPINFVVFVYK